MSPDTPSPTSVTTQLQAELSQVGAQVEEVVADSVRALLLRDVASAERILADTPAQDMTGRLLARIPQAFDEAPSATLISGLQLAAAFDRTIGLGLEVCRLTLELGGESGSERAALGDLARLAGAKVKDALDALASGDVEHAARLMQDDPILDAHHAQTYSDLVGLIHADVTRVPRAQTLYRLGRILEQLGDQAAELAGLVRPPSVACA